MSPKPLRKDFNETPVPSQADVDFLVDAASEGENELVADLLDEFPGAINMPNSNQTYALICAAENGHKDTVALLASRGANLEIKTYSGNESNHGRTALLWAANNRHIDVMEVLLDKGADIETQDTDGWTALMYAATKNTADMAKMLLAKGASLEPKRPESLEEQKAIWTRDLAWTERQNRPEVRQILERDMEAGKGAYVTARLLAKMGNHEEVSACLEEWNSRLERQAEATQQESIVERQERLKRLAAAGTKLRLGPKP